LRLDPRLALAYLYRGQAHHYRLCLADFDEALRLNPNDSEARRWREDCS
jgi:hypothetical protein